MKQIIYVKELLDAAGNETHEWVDEESKFVFNRFGMGGRFKIGSPMMPKFEVSKK